MTDIENVVRRRLREEAESGDTARIVAAAMATAWARTASSDGPRSNRRTRWLVPGLASVGIAAAAAAAILVGLQIGGPEPTTPLASTSPSFSEDQMLVGGRLLLDASRAGTVPRVESVTGRGDATGLRVMVSPGVIAEFGEEKLKEQFAAVAKMPVSIIEGEDPGPGLPILPSGQ
jgi:hypothetical protein